MPARRPPDSAPAESGAGFDEVAEQLYAGLPDAFIPARDASVKQARARGDRQLAARLGELRRPTQSAWLVNLLVRREREPLEQLLALGDALREAEAVLSGDALRQLSAQRNEVVRVLVRTAGRLAVQAGSRANAAVLAEVQATLQAALAEPEVADAVRGGRLVKPAEHAGFGGLGEGISAPVARPAAAPAPAARRTAQEEAARRKAEAARREAEEARRQAEANVAQAQAAVAAAEQAAQHAEAELAAADERVEQLREQLYDAERRQAEARLAARSTARERASAQDQLQHARAALARVPSVEPRRHS